ncbi:MAG: DUF1254 domain-containing protein [Planctomycetota bacterium]
MLLVLLFVAELLTAAEDVGKSGETIDTRIGELSFTHDFANGYPTLETQQLLFSEMDFQRACQAYLWAIPYVSMAQWQWAHEEQIGAKNGQIVFVESYEDKLGGLTYNTTTPYVLPFIDMRNGPWIVVMPEGEVRGAANSFWQIGITQMTKPGKYLFVPPTHDVPANAEKEGFSIVKMPTVNMLLGIRLMSAGRDVRLEMLNKIEIYPYSEKDNPKPRGYITPDGKPWQAWHPRGLTYWERLADIINREPVHERDRFMLAMLKSIGIEKGKLFKPDERQKKILIEAALVGEAMAKANDFFNPRITDAHYVEGSMWEYAAVCTPFQRREFYDDLDERAAWFYEAVTNDPMMHGHETGKGQVYMAAYRDGDGDWLDGGTNYTLHIPPKAPAKAFWSMTIYDVATRCIIINETKQADRSSRMDLLENADGSVTLYIGPDKPVGGKAKNWVQTMPGKAWFPYFRLYSPKQEFLDKTWILPDIEKAK